MASKSKTTLQVRVTFYDIEKFRDEMGFDSHRDMVAYKFKTEHHCQVIDHTKLKYFDKKYGFLVEGDTNVSLLRE